MKRVRKLFADKIDAEIFERQYLNESKTNASLNHDPRTLSELVNYWYKYHGINLADGLRRKKVLLDIANTLGNPVASSITPEIFVNFRFKKLQGGLTKKTINNHHGYLNALFNKLHKLKIIDYKSPIESVEFIKIQESQLSYLAAHQISEILEAIASGAHNQSTLPVARLCLLTGARWGEAENLQKKHLHNCRVTYENTKGYKTRTVPMDPSEYKKLWALCEFKNPNDRIFTNCIGSFRRSMNRTDINPPAGQCTHILRHTFASHFVMNGGGILTLQKILGHVDIRTTLRYAHLSPDHLADAINLNPISSPVLDT